MRRAPALIVLVLASASAAAPLHAHEGVPLEPHDLARAWVADPWILVPLVASAVLYGLGLRRLWHEQAGRGIRRWEAWCFAIGWLTLLLALLSPLHSLGEVLFSAHMSQHALLMSLAAPLLVLGRPIVPMLWALPIAWRRGLGAGAKAGAVRRPWRFLTQPLTAWAVHAVAILLWHVPSLYEATIRSDVMHALQHASFLGTALLFWWALLHGRERRMGYGVGIIYLFTTMLYTGAFGALLAFAPRPWYTAYLATTGPWGFTPLEDQQLAGLIMWIPASISYLVAALVLLSAWLREADRRTMRWEQRRAGGVLAVVLLLGACGERVKESDEWQEAALLTSGHPHEGRAKLRAYGCTSCHVIPGVPGGDGLVGPSLKGIASRSYIAGSLPNTPKNMMEWIRDPQSFDSATAMPNVGVTARDSRDLAAYLYTLK